MRKFTGWYWGVIGGAAVLLAAVAAFFAWGPVGIGGGPLSVAFVASTGTVPQTRPSMILIPVQAGPSAAAVIDAVAITGGGGYPAPVLLDVVGDQDEACSGIWWPMTGHNSFLQRCAKGGTAPLVGHVVPMRQPTLMSTQGARPAARGTDVGIEVGPPGVTGCWGVAEVAVHYHVGLRHYTAVGGESVSGCTSSATGLASPAAEVSPPLAPGGP